MDCELDTCIFNRDFKCLYDSITVNNVGMCAACMIVQLEKDELEKKKEEQYNLLRERAAYLDKFD